MRPETQQRLTLVFGVLFLGMLLMLGRLMMLAEHANAEDHRRFFLAIDSGEPDQVLALCDERLAERIDRRALADWLVELRARHGRFRRIARQGFVGTQETVDGTTRVRTEGPAEFDRGTILAQLEYVGGRLVDIRIEDDGLRAAWLPDAGAGR